MNDFKQRNRISVREYANARLSYDLSLEGDEPIILPKGHVPSKRQ